MGQVHAVMQHWLNTREVGLTIVMGTLYIDMHYRHIVCVPGRAPATAVEPLSGVGAGCVNGLSIRTIYTYCIVTIASLSTKHYRRRPVQ